MISNTMSAILVTIFSTPARIATVQVGFGVDAQSKLNPGSGFVL
jgi:hypothetical protein